MDDVYQSMIEWNAVKGDATYLQKIFSTGNTFAFTIIADHKSDYLHAYPGVLNDQLYFQLISKYHDVHDNFKWDQKPDFLVTCKVEQNSPEITQGVISKQEADVRISSWNNAPLRNKWLSVQAANDSMYQAFSIPTGDVITGDPHLACFAFQPDPNSPDDVMMADLIIVNVTKQKIIYADIVRPVPPFKPLEQATFGLLNFVQQE